MADRLDLVFLWHMHQPDYRTGPERTFALPWTLLHALKDYTDMAGHFERHPQVRSVINFVPTLLEQIEDYRQQLAGGSIRDPLLAALAATDEALADPGRRRFVLETCFLGNHERLVEPYPHYRRLHQLYLAAAGEPDAVAHYFATAYFADLVTWYFLVWFGETERRRSPLLARLFAQGTHFCEADRWALLALVKDVLDGLLPRYRRLAEAGQIELSTTPYAHPLAPLLIDLGSAREALPACPLPQSPRYPGGRERVSRHLALAKAVAAKHWGHPASGIWPAEGALSDAALALIDQAGATWTASSESVLAQSLRANGGDYQRARDLYRPWRVAGAGAARIYFRDERLSDLIGFEYARWHGRDAAAHLINELESIRRAAPDGETPIVSIILDGENAWEYYPYNGYYFFNDLFEGLADHPHLRTTTYAALSAEDREAADLPHLVAGSWVHGNLSTWIGDSSKNRAWDLLCMVKQSYDQMLSSGRLSPEQADIAEKKLLGCESSDWFWWFGDYNPARSVASFDALFRENLRDLYESLGLPAPASLDQAIAHGAGHPEAGGAMRRAK